MGRFERTEKLLGNLAPLRRAKVIVFGIGGVGGHCAEALARSGVGQLTLCDGDVVAESNINRQIVALSSTVGRFKADVMAERARDIDPQCTAIAHNCFLTEDNLEEFSLTEYDYIADCVDDVKAKVALAEFAYNHSIPIISAMGAGNKIYPRFEVADIKKTTVCPLARIVRTELKKRGVEKLKVVYSIEQPRIKERTPASTAFVPSVAGLTMAGEIVRNIMGIV